MKKTLRILLGVLILTMLSTTPVFAGDYSQGINSVYVNGEKKKIVADANGDMVQQPAGTWYEQDGYKFYFIEDNYIAWDEIVTIDGKKYLFEENGRLCTGEFVFYDKETGKYKWRLADENGVLYEPGWHVVSHDYYGDRIYYVSEDYTLPEDVLEIDGKRYYFDTGKVSVGEIWLYDNDGSSKLIITDETGAFIELKNAWYNCSYGWSGEHKHYYGEDGYCYKNGIYKIDGVYYKFDSEGRISAESTESEDFIGWVKKYNYYGETSWYYYTESDVFLNSGIYEINGKKYYFDSSGVLQTGFIACPNEDYSEYTYVIADENGVIYQNEGWLTLDGETYYVLEGGTLVVDQIYMIDNKYYYFNYTGQLQSGQIWYEDKWHYFNEDGSAKTGWFVENNGNYYYNPDGAKCIGWKTIDGEIYYLSENNGGKMAVGMTYIDGDRYYFNYNGALLTKKGWVQIDQFWYYVTEDYTLASAAIFTIDGKKYYFDSVGRLRTGFFEVYDSETQSYKKMLANADGVLYEPGWNTIQDEYGEETYYVGKDYILLSDGVHEINGKKYYFNGVLLQKGHIWILNGDGNYVQTVTDETGALVDLRNAWYECSYDGNVHKHYLDADGALLENGVYEIGGKKYQFDSNGNLRIGLLSYPNEDYSKYTYKITDENGAIYETAGWVTLDGKTYYVSKDGTIVVDQIYMINNKYYYFNSVGERQTGQIWYEGKWHYFKEDGSARTGWIYERSAWFYYDSDGKLCTGWKTINGVTYYLNIYDGSMVSGYNIIDDQYYYFDSDGALLKKQGWVYRDNAWYYFNTDYSIQRGWKTIGAATYYLDKYNGRMVSGYTVIDDKFYCFNSDGVLLKKQGWVKMDGYWYYFNTDSSLVRGWSTIGGQKYYFDSETARMAENGVGRAGEKNYLFDSNGVVYERKGWAKIGGYWHYFNQDCSVLIGWNTIDGKKYYFDEKTGRMATGRVVMNGMRYYFGSDGALYDEAIFWTWGELSKDDPLTQRMEKIWEAINKYADPDYHLNVNKVYMDDKEYAEIQAKAREVIAGRKTQYEKIRAIVEYISDTIYYDWAYYNYVYNNGTHYNGLYTDAYSVFKEKRTVCEGYANLTKAMMESIGIPCMHLYGDNHKFNAVYDSDKDRWMIVDCTWSSRNTYDYDEDTKKYEWYYGGATEDYFDLNPGEIAATSNHEIYSLNGLVDANGNGEYYLDCSGNLNEWKITDYQNGYKQYSYLEWSQGGAGWKQNSTGWWYQNADGTYPKNCWKMIDNKWYAFDARGYMRQGWFNDNGSWYYLGNGGAMATGWVKDSGSWYYMKSNGAMATGWVYDAGAWYYMKSNGAMATGWIQDGGTWYYLYANGSMAKNTWIGSYYLNASGAWVNK